MKKHLLRFVQRGLVALGIGPLVLAVVYLFLQRYAAVQTLTVREVCVGIFSLSALAFVAGGMNFIYQVERLPLMAAISIHGGVLYAAYLITYFVNGWLERSILPVLVFTGVFVVGYLVIWVVICSVMKKKTAGINAKLKEKQYPEQ